MKSSDKMIQTVRYLGGSTSAVVVWMAGVTSSADVSGDKTFVVSFSLILLVLSTKKASPAEINPRKRRNTQPADPSFIDNFTSFPLIVSFTIFRLLGDLLIGSFT